MAQQQLLPGSISSTTITSLYGFASGLSLSMLKLFHEALGRELLLTALLSLPAHNWVFSALKTLWPNDFFMP